MNQPDLRSAHAAFLSFLIRFAAMLAAACAVFLLFSRLPDAGRYVITPPSFSGRTPDVLREAIVPDVPAASAPDEAKKIGAAPIVYTADKPACRAEI